MLNPAVTHAADQLHAKNDRRARLSARADPDVGVAHPSANQHPRQGPVRSPGSGIRHACSGRYAACRASITASVKSSHTSHHDDRSSSRCGTTQRPVRRTEPPRWSIRITSSACAVAAPGMPGAGHQVGGERGQLTESAGGQSRFQALIQLVGGQPTVPRGDAQYLHDPVPVRIRGPHFGPRAGSGRLTGRPETCRHIPSPCRSRLRVGCRYAPGEPTLYRVTAIGQAQVPV